MQRKPDRVLGFGPTVKGNWRVRYVVDGRTKYLYRPTELDARVLFEQLKAAIENGLPVPMTAEDARPAPKPPEVGLGDVPVPQTLEELKALVGQTLTEVRAGQVDPRRAPAIVQLCRAQMAILRSQPPAEDLGRFESMSDPQLLEALCGLILERFSPDEVRAFQTQLSRLLEEK